MKINWYNLKITDTELDWEKYRDVVKNRWYIRRRTCLVFCVVLALCVAFIFFGNFLIHKIIDPRTVDILGFTVMILFFISFIIGLLPLILTAGFWANRNDSIARKLFIEERFPRIITTRLVWREAVMIVFYKQYEENMK